MLTENQFRALCLAMPGAVEGEHMDHPDFRCNGRIFATIQPARGQGMVKLTPEQQRVLLQKAPGVFSPASGAWGRQGCTMVDLAAAERASVGAAITDAWQNVLALPKARAKKAPTKAKGTTTNKRKQPGRS